MANKQSQNGGGGRGIKLIKSGTQKVEGVTPNMFIRVQWGKEGGPKSIIKFVHTK